MQGLAALRRLIQSKATTGKQDHREGLTGKAAAQGMCALLADSDALLFLCLIEALHLHKVLSRWTAVWRPTVTAVTAATAPRPCAQRRRDDEGCGAGGCDARSAAGLCLDANLLGKKKGKRQRSSASDAAEDADAGPDAPRNAATPSVSDLRGERAWFCEELSPARLLDAVCQLFGGDSGMLLDLMLSPDNQVTFTAMLSIRRPGWTCWRLRVLFVASGGAVHTEAPDMQLWTRGRAGAGLHGGSAGTA